MLLGFRDEVRGGGAFSFLAGRNGSGKTTLFEVLTLLRDISALGDCGI